ncbi:MAG: phospho-sugar mutase [Acidimicrobiales bacterium]
MKRELLTSVREWIAGDPDERDRATLQQLLEEGNEDELRRRFEAPLSFGTAGLRGPVMAGPAGMNRYTVRRATQGVIAWLEETGVDSSSGVVVGRDARHGSEAFNDEVVSVLLGAGVPVLEMPRPLPTPFVAYGVKVLGAAAGIMITASHNPPQDNGYKLYGPEGSQIVPPNDRIVERYALAATEPELAARTSTLHRFIGDDVLESYYEHFAQRFAVHGGTGLRVTYTPLHGVGGEPMMRLFRDAGYRRVEVVEPQFSPDGDFPTLPFPNPEEPGALDLAMERADETGSALVVANDPDADRLGVAVNAHGGWRVLRGDEIGWLLASSLLDEMDPARDLVATTIVSSTMLEKMARRARIPFVSTLTGFKWIARGDGERTLRFGYEEALGFAVDPLVADKDGMSAALALCRLADRLSHEGKSLLDRLDQIERDFGVHAGGQVSIRAEGPAASEEIRDAVARLRSTPPLKLGGLEVSEVIDLAKGWRGLMATDGIYLALGEMGRVVVRPSGTEPKLKAYIEVTLAPDERRLVEQRAEASRYLLAVRDELQRILRLQRVA